MEGTGELGPAGRGAAWEGGMVSEESPFPRGAGILQEARDLRCPCGVNRAHPPVWGLQGLRGSSDPTGACGGLVVGPRHGECLSPKEAWS